MGLMFKNTCKEFCNNSIFSSVILKEANIPFENYGAACNLYKQTAITCHYTIIMLDVKYYMISLRESGLFKLFGLIE